MSGNVMYFSYEDELNVMGPISLLTKYDENYEPEFFSWLQSPSVCYKVAKKCPSYHKHPELASAFLKLLSDSGVLIGNFSCNTISMIGAIVVAGIDQKTVERQLAKQCGGYLVLKNMWRLRQYLTIDPLEYFDDYKDRMLAESKHNMPEICMSFCRDYNIIFDDIFNRHEYLLFSPSELNHFDPRDFVRYVVDHGGTTGCLSRHFRFDNSRISFLVLFEIAHQNKKNGHYVDYKKLISEYEKVANQLSWFERTEFYFFTKKYKKIHSKSKRS